MLWCAGKQVSRDEHVGKQWDPGGHCCDAGWEAMLRGNDERLPGWIPAPKPSRDANSLTPDFPGHLLGVESEGEAQDQTREMVIEVGWKRSTGNTRMEQEGEHFTVKPQSESNWSGGDGWTAKGPQGQNPKVVLTETWIKVRTQTSDGSVMQGQSSRSGSQEDSLARECWLRAQAGFLGIRWLCHSYSSLHPIPACCC